MAITDISPGNKALEFIASRLNDPHYRGAHSSQHNRYTMDQVVCILELLNKYAPGKSLMPIRTTDLSKRPHNTSEEATYAKFCDEAKKLAGIGTQDAMRKNLFLDLHRMGFIERFDFKKEPVDPFNQKGIKKYAAITDQGLKLIGATNVIKKYLIYSKGIDILLGGQIDMLLGILRNSDYGISSINIHEYMFILSAIGTGYRFSITIEEAVALVRESRNLSTIQRKALVSTLKAELKPNKYSGTKVDKRDYHNWHNEAVQVYNLLNQTVYFEVRGEQLVLKHDPSPVGDVVRRLARSLDEKYKYFTNHAVSKSSGFELHHIVPLAWSESIHHFKLLDKWENMIYIDAFHHAQISQNKNKNVVLDFIDTDVRLSDYSKNVIDLVNKKDVIYREEHQKIMKKYNDDLLKAVTI